MDYLYKIMKLFLYTSVIWPLTFFFRSGAVVEACVHENAWDMWKAPARWLVYYKSLRELSASMLHEQDPAWHLSAADWRDGGRVMKGKEVRVHRSAPRNRSTVKKGALRVDGWRIQMHIVQFSFHIYPCCHTAYCHSNPRPRSGHLPRWVGFCEEPRCTPAWLFLRITRVGNNTIVWFELDCQCHVLGNSITADSTYKDPE